MQTRHIAPALAIAAMVLALAACGGKDEETMPGNSGLGPVADQDMGDDPDEPGADDGLACPPGVNPGLTGPDITGIQPGMTLDEALATARCALGEAAIVTTEARWLDRLDTYGVELDTQFFTVKKGENRACDYAREWQQCEGSLKWSHVDEIVSVATPGAPGKEMAGAIWRTQNFREGKMPAATAVLEALVAKYGPAQQVEESNKPWARSSGRRDLKWVFDAAGNPISQSNPLYLQCLNAIHASAGDTRVSWRQGCGMTISALLLLSGSNPGLVMELHTAMVDQTRLYQHVETMKEDLAQAGQARRDAEVQAGGEASDVRL